MQNSFDISGYIAELAVITAITGIIYLLGDKMKGGLGKLLSVACSLIITFYLISPLADFFDKNLPNIENSVSTPVHGELSMEEYYSILAKTTIENLELSAKRELTANYDLTDDEYLICFSGKIQNDKFTLNSCDITLKTIHALSKRHDIESYIKDNYGCPCIFTENIEL